MPSAVYASKYRNQPTTIDGITFQSRKEGKRYTELKLLERAKQIKGLTLQPRYPLHVNGHKICTYVGDFEYLELHSGKQVCEDSKGFRTRDYQNKRKLFMALYPHIDHREI